MQQKTDLAVAGLPATWVAWVVARPGAALALIALVVAVAILAASRLSIDTDSSRMLSPDLPFQARANALNSVFPRVKNQIVAVVRADNEDAADAAVAGLASALAQSDGAFDWVFAPAADPWLSAHGLLYLDLDALDRRLARLGKSANLLARLRVDQTMTGFMAALAEATTLARVSGADLAALDPLYAETAAVLKAHREGRDRPFRWQSALAGGSEGPVLRVVTAGPRFDYARLNPAEPALDAIHAAVAGLDPATARAVEIGVTGDPALRAEELESVSSGIGISLALSLVFVAGLLWLALGSVARAALAMGTLVATLAITAGVAGLAVGALNLISIAFVVLMVGLGIDFAIHFIAHFDEHSGEASNRGRALIASAGSIGTALCLSAATTALAFLAFATTDFDGMAQLGLIGAAGVMIALAVALTIIPAFVMLWPGFADGPRRHALPMLSPGIGRALGWVAVLSTLALAALSPAARFDADPMGLRDPSAASVLAYGMLAQDPSHVPLRLSLLAPDAAAAESAATRLAALPEVHATTWLGDLVPLEQEAKLDLIDLAYPSLQHAVEGTPTEFTDTATDAKAMAARLMALDSPAAHALAAELPALTAVKDPVLAERLFRHFPALIARLRQQLDGGPVAPEDLPEALRRLYLAEDGTHRVEIVPAADVSDPASLRAFVAAVAAEAPGAAGPPDQIDGAAGAVAQAILQAAALALAGCALLAWLTLRSLARTAAILLPLALAGAATMGAGVLIGVPFNYANVIVVPLMIGIGIDSGVHLALRAGRLGGHVFDTSTPRAVLFSALTTIAAFGTLGFSAHSGTASMGILLALSLAISVAVIFALTPALIRFSGRFDE